MKRYFKPVLLLGTKRIRCRDVYMLWCLFAVLWSQASEQSIQRCALCFPLIRACLVQPESIVPELGRVPTMELLSGEQWVRFLTIPHRFRCWAYIERQWSYSGFAILHPAAFPLATSAAVLMFVCVCIIASVLLGDCSSQWEHREGLMGEGACLVCSVGCITLFKPLRMQSWSPEVALNVLLISILAGADG